MTEQEFLATLEPQFALRVKASADSNAIDVGTAAWLLEQKEEAALRGLAWAFKHALEHAFAEMTERMRAQTAWDNDGGRTLH
jgi:hypothetical protein